MKKENNIKNELEIDENFKTFFTENEENILSYTKKLEEIENYWNKYFEDSLYVLKKEIVNDVNITEENIEKEYINRTKILKEKVIHFMNRDVELFLKEVKI